ncbi:hypothetical protein KC946_03745 [Candidatus Saccharibacteria bacterium]|nr:hypothetical protein [Candidatus Saccharibacteria bacterium]
MVQKTYKRPVGIILLEVYGLLIGVANIIAGIVAIVNRNDVALQLDVRAGSSTLVAAGIVAIVVGAIQAMMAYLLGNASNVVRMIFGVVASLNLVAGVWGILALSGTHQAASVTSSVFSVLVLYLLFNHRADEYFGHPYKSE